MKDVFGEFWLKVHNEKKRYEKSNWFWIMLMSMSMCVTCVRFTCSFLCLLHFQSFSAV